MRRKIRTALIELNASKRKLANDDVRIRVWWNDSEYNTNGKIKLYYGINIPKLNYVDCIDVMIDISDYIKVWRNRKINKLLK